MKNHNYHHLIDKLIPKKPCLFHFVAFKTVGDYNPNKEKIS